MSTLLDQAKPIMEVLGFGSMSMVPPGLVKKDACAPSDAGDSVVRCSSIFSKMETNAWSKPPPPVIPGSLGGPPPTPEDTFKGFVIKSLWDALSHTATAETGTDYYTVEYSQTIPKANIIQVLLVNQYCFFTHPHTSIWISDLTEDETTLQFVINVFVPEMFTSMSNVGDPGMDRRYVRREEFASGNIDRGIQFTIYTP